MHSKTKTKKVLFLEIGGINFFLITHPPASTNVHLNIYFQFQKSHKKARSQIAEETKEEKRISVENLTGYDIVCKFAVYF